MPRATTVARAVLVASVAVLAVALGLIAGSNPWLEDATVSSVGTRPAVASAAATPSSTPVQPMAATVPSATPAPTAEPVAVRIPAIDVDTTIVPVGMDEHRAVQVPEDIGLVGWYEPTGVVPGSPVGSAVLVAHRDGSGGGQGVFYDLGQLDEGDRVLVTDESGRELRFEVVAREVLDKRGLPVEELFGWTGPARLTLISCGGEYIPERGGYQSNVVVTAVPA